MDDNPYSPPEHYARRPSWKFPFTAYLLAGWTLIAGVIMAGFGLYYRRPVIALSGLFWTGVGLTCTYGIIRYRRRST